MTKRKIEFWVISPAADGEFISYMEEVLETYGKAYDPTAPILCMDEQPIQLRKETRQSIPAAEDHPQRVDYEYERAGTARIFMFAEPLSDSCEATGTEQNCGFSCTFNDRALARRSAQVLKRTPTTRH
jgi:hypothetical protein